MARPKKTEQVLDIVPEEVELKVETPKVKEVVVFDSVDSTIKLVTERESRNPRFKPI